MAFLKAQSQIDVELIPWLMLKHKHPKFFNSIQIMADCLLLLLISITLNSTIQSQNVDIYEYNLTDNNNTTIISIDAIHIIINSLSNITINSHIHLNYSNNSNWHNIINHRNNPSYRRMLDYSSHWQRMERERLRRIAR